MTLNAEFTTLLKSGSIWKTKARGRLVLVLCVTNCNMNQEKNPSQVVFRYGTSDVVSCPVETFKNSMEYVRQDEAAEAFISTVFSHNISETPPQQPTVTVPVAALAKAIEEEGEEAETIANNNEDSLTEEDNANIYYGLHLSKADETKDTVISKADLNECFVYYQHNTDDSFALGFVPQKPDITVDNIREVFTAKSSEVEETYYNEANVVVGDSAIALHLDEYELYVRVAIVNGCVQYVAYFEKPFESATEDEPYFYEEDESDNDNEKEASVEEDVLCTTETVKDNKSTETKEAVVELTEEKEENVLESATKESKKENAFKKIKPFDKKLPKHVQLALNEEPHEDIFKEVEHLLEESSNATPSTTSNTESKKEI